MTLHKAWGTAEVLSDGGDGFREERLRVDPGGYCSRHFHRRMFNLFRVEEGTLLVKLYRDRDDPTPGRQIRLGPGMGWFVPPMHIHRFSSPDGCFCVERAWAWDPEDIERLDEGGKFRFF